VQATVFLNGPIHRRCFRSSRPGCGSATTGVLFGRLFFGAILTSAALT